MCEDRILSKEQNTDEENMQAYNMNKISSTPTFASSFKFPLLSCSTLIILNFCFGFFVCFCSFARLIFFVFCFLFFVLFFVVCCLFVCLFVVCLFVCLFVVLCCSFFCLFLAPVPLSLCFVSSYSPFTRCYFFFSASFFVSSFSFCFFKVNR